MLSNVKRLITEKQYARFKALHSKFIKACGIHHEEARERMMENLTMNKSETSWAPDEDSLTPGPAELQKSRFSKVSKMKSLISIEEESENMD